MEGKEVPLEPSLKQQAEVILRHLELVCEHRKKAKIVLVGIKGKDELRDAIKDLYGFS